MVGWWDHGERGEGGVEVARVLWCGLLLLFLGKYDGGSWGRGMFSYAFDGLSCGGVLRRRRFRIT